jgi:hypothetical protein
MKLFVDRILEKKPNAVKKWQYIIDQHHIGKKIEVDSNLLNFKEFHAIILSWKDKK